MRDPDKPQQIIDAAIRVFARNGYYNSRVSDIAREAGIASGTIYLYFKTKDEILVTLFREKMAEFVAPASARRSPASRTGGQDPPAGGRCTSACWRQSPELAEVVQVELRQGQKFFRGASAHEVSAYFELIASVLEEGVAAGSLPADLPVKVATKVLFGAMDQMATSWVLGKRGVSPRRHGRRPAVATIFLARSHAPMAYETLIVDARGELRGHHAEPAARQRHQRGRSCAS